MRDLGFPFRWSDLHASNHYARGFEDDGREYEAVTAIEVLEHLEDPVESLRTWIDDTSTETFIFTQETFVGEPPLEDWWYYAPVAGQHISFHQPRTLEHIAGELDMSYAPMGMLHAFTRRPVTANPLDRIFMHPRVLPLYTALHRWRRESLTQRDFQAIADGITPGDDR